MLATLVSTVRQTLMSVNRCHANTTPPVGNDRTQPVLTSAMPLHPALTASVFLGTLVIRTVAFGCVLFLPPANAQ